MVTVLRSGAFTVTIYTDDHPPAHVHVSKDRTELKIDLISMTILKNVRMTGRDARDAFRLVAENRARLLADWSRIHG